MRQIRRSATEQSSDGKSEPADTLRTLKAVAEIRGAGEQELAQTTAKNATKFFDLPLGTQGG